MRVYEIAKEVGIPNKDLIAKIRALGLEVNNHMSSLDPDDVVRIKRSLEKEKQSVAQPQQTQRLATGAVLRRRSSGEKPADAGEGERSAEREPVRVRTVQPETDRTAPATSQPHAATVLRRRTEDGSAAPSTPPAARLVPVRASEPAISIAAAPGTSVRAEPSHTQEALARPAPDR